MVVEVDSLIENKVYEVVDRPAYKRVVSSKWVFKKKRGISGAIETKQDWWQKDSLKRKV